MEINAANNAPLPQAFSPALAEATRRNVDPEKIGKSFEGMFASMILKQMRQSLDGGLFANDPSDVLGGLFDSFMGTHIAEAGGFGVADMIRSQLERQGERTAST